MYKNLNEWNELECNRLTRHDSRCTELSSAGAAQTGHCSDDIGARDARDKMIDPGSDTGSVHKVLAAVSDNRSQFQ